MPNFFFFHVSFFCLFPFYSFFNKINYSSTFLKKIMTDKDKSLNIPNLHPDHRGLSSPEGSPSQTNGYLQDPDAQLSQSFKDRIETFVGSYSRTSMMHMAENVMVSEGGMVSFFFYR